MSSCCTRPAPSRWLLLIALVTGVLLASTATLFGAGAARAATLPSLTLTLNSGSITVGGSPQSGGVNVVSSAAKGLKEPAAVLVLLNPGVTPEELHAALGSKAVKDPNVVRKYGSIVFDAEAPPGGKSEAQTTLQAGTYVALALEGEGKPAASASFKVTTSSSPVALPAPQATERSIDFGFRGPAVLKDGELVRFENEGWVVHMDFAFPAKGRKAAEQIVRDLRAGKEKGIEKLVAGPPASFAGPLSTGSYQQETIEARPGWYVQACFMDTQDGRSHTLIGMERIIKITK